MGKSKNLLTSLFIASSLIMSSCEMPSGLDNLEKRVSVQSLDKKIAKEDSNKKDKGKKKGQIYLTDHFNDGNYDGWEFSNDSQYGWSVYGGELIANSGSGNNFRRSAIHPSENIDVSNAAYEFDVVKEPGSWYTNFNFYFCDGDSQWNISTPFYHGYGLIVNSQGNGDNVTMAKFTNGVNSISDLSWVDGTQDGSSLNTQDFQAYHYRIMKNNDRIRVYRDNNLIQSVIDSSPLGLGNIGFVKQNCVWRFDNVSVTRLKGNEKKDKNPKGNKGYRN